MTAVFFRNWAEIMAFALLIIGFLFSLFAPSAVLSYIMIFLAGMMGGRIVYQKRKNQAFPWVLILVGFLIGYLIGSRYGNYLFTIILFLVGILISYYLHIKGFIRDIKLF